MRPIPNRQLRRFAILATLQESNRAIALELEANRKQFIDDHEHECSQMRNALWTVGSAKCWYSEVSLQEPEGQVEHYRPKKRLSGAGHNGYWWRAFDWQNLRLAHPTVNRRKTDYLTGRRAGKGSYFPLRNEARRATTPAEEANEEPVLLDPAVPSDSFLIAFSQESGAPRPRYSKEQNEWLNRRAEESIEYYHLDEASWNAKRADLMAEVNKLSEQLEAIAVQQLRDDAAYQRMINQIVDDYLNPFAEFSSACLQVVRERGLLEHFAPGL
jgi:5-methylcytosine-specific restriction endonuclease McrA